MRRCAISSSGSIRNSRRRICARHSPATSRSRLRTRSTGLLITTARRVGRSSSRMMATNSPACSASKASARRQPSFGGMYVDRSHRGGGLAQTMLAEAEKSLPRGGYVNVDAQHVGTSTGCARVLSQVRLSPRARGDRRCAIEQDRRRRHPPLSLREKLARLTSSEIACAVARRAAPAWLLPCGPRGTSHRCVRVLRARTIDCSG